MGGTDIEQKITRIYTMSEGGGYPAKGLTEEGMCELKAERGEGGNHAGVWRRHFQQREEQVQRS